MDNHTIQMPKVTQFNATDQSKNGTQRRLGCWLSI